MPETCPECGQLVGYGQRRLSDAEIERLPIGNQNTDTPTLIEWQAVKGAADYFGVTDWVSRVDTSLSYPENIDIMRREGTAQTMREYRP